MSQDVRIAIAGIAGKMGLAIAKRAAAHHLQLRVATLSPSQDATQTVGAMIALPGYDFFPIHHLEDQRDAFDVLIDFTTPEATLHHVKLCSELKKSIVIGTTGLDEQKQFALKQYAKEIAIVFAPNMSRGVNITLNLLEKLTQLIGHEADIEILEAHHRHKKDAPSGTALNMGESIAKELGKPLKELASFARHGISESGREKKIGFSVVRAGDIVGEHTAMFALSGERIEIKHVATSRDTFAEGALTAAQWIQDKAPGLYSMQDVLGL
ncbi:MAG: 4-hydroxy-tetrahydrodipicolinate reductase [Candidatus Berkiella sp.]